jgi:hypothetical protein
VLSLDPDLPELRQLTNELAQVLYSYNANGEVQLPRRRPGTAAPTWPMP